MVRTGSDDLGQQLAGGAVRLPQSYQGWRDMAQGAIPLTAQAAAFGNIVARIYGLTGEVIA